MEPDIDRHGVQHTSKWNHQQGWMFQGSRDIPASNSSWAHRSLEPQDKSSECPFSRMTKRPSYLGIWNCQLKAHWIILSGSQNLVDQFISHVSLATSSIFDTFGGNFTLPPPPKLRLPFQLSGQLLQTEASCHRCLGARWHRPFGKGRKIWFRVSNQQKWQLQYCCMTMTYYDILWHTMTYYDILWHTMTYYDILRHTTTTYYDILWHTMTYYDILLQHTLTYYDMLWHTMTYYDILLQHTMTYYYNILWHTMTYYDILRHTTTTYYDILWHTMTYYDILWHTMTYYDILWHTMTYYDILWHTMTYYDILWHTMTYYDILWHTTTYYDILWHTMTYYDIL